MSDDARDMSSATVDAYWASGEQVTVPLPGTPDCRVVFDPRGHSVSLLSPLTGKEPDVVKLRSVSFSTAVDGSRVWGEVRVDASESHQAAFALVTTIANRLQRDGESLAVAVPHAVDTYQALLARRKGLNDEQQRGLFGELLVFRQVVLASGAATAVDAWHGPLAEEHDLFLAGLHLEVKTTAAERRKHMIGGVSQLSQSPGTPLWLVSVQITAGVEGAGQSLPALVAAARADLADERIEFDRRLENMGWDDLHADLYPAVWQLRSPPRSYLVDGDFPRMTAALIADRVPSWSLVSDINYRIDATDLPFPSAPAVLSGFVETEGDHA
ncbi:MAG: hypothetical protein QOJ72_797 [Nocardioidaceae bacterium]|jgi:hypothetical protein|nr:hypothetical protein [Nocardioidaceae bacterium]